MGRLFLEEDPSGDNYTTANDCRALLESIYRGTCVSEEASAEMYEFLQEQTRVNKIPAGLTETSASAANKTGELSGEYGDFVENDIAIVRDGGEAYILCVLTDNLRDNSAAAAKIADLSKLACETITAK